MEEKNIQDKPVKPVAVVCCLWQGDFRGRNYDWSWVLKLRNMVHRNLSYKFDFFCFSNNCQVLKEGEFDPQFKGINIVPLRREWPGWWPKMECFIAPELSNYDIVLVLDLDVFVMHGLDLLIQYYQCNSSNRACFAPQTEAMKMERNREGKKVIQRLRTGCFVFNPEFTKKIGIQFYEEANSIIRIYRGDQDWLGYVMPRTIELFPSEWFEKTKNIIKKSSQVPENETVVVFGNHVKNPQACTKWKWAREVWNV